MKIKQVFYIILYLKIVQHLDVFLAKGPLFVMLFLVDDIIDHIVNMG
jgi:hypothetical protein